MQKTVLLILLSYLYLCNSSAYAQEGKDTFFLAKRKGLLGKLGRSISTNPPPTKPVKLVNPFLKYEGKIIRSIDFLSLGFERNIYDTSLIKNKLGTQMANQVHKNTTWNVLHNNLFFKEGDPLSPLLIADNERYLRELPFIRDVRIVIDEIPGNKDSVDMIVITKDVFSIGGNININNTKRAEIEVREENFEGSGTKIAFTGLYDKVRDPMYGVGGEIKRRNIMASFIDVTVGFKNFKNAYNSGRREETGIYTKIERPLVSAYFTRTGALEASYNNTANNYRLADSLYKTAYNYTYLNIDGWYGYGFGGKSLRPGAVENPVRSFVAVRSFYQKFFRTPFGSDPINDYRYVNSFGALVSINVFKQNFYKTGFVYGFGIYEDIPQGFNVSLTTGWSNKNQRIRPYSGIDFLYTHYNQKGFYSTYTFKMGSNFYKRRFEDCALLFNVDHFTRLKYLNPKWYNRNFFSAGIAAQINPFINEPLFINSVYGLPYFNSGFIAADLRATAKGETVFYGTTKLLGFRFAPFLFTDASLLKPIKQSLDKSKLYSALGGGVRSRNENLVFGTIELRGYYFPRTEPGFKKWKVELATGLRFRFFNQFIKQPDFIIAN